MSPIEGTGVEKMERFVNLWIKNQYEKSMQVIQMQKAIQES